MDVVLRLVKAAEHVRGGTDQRIIARLVRRELSDTATNCQLLLFAKRALLTSQKKVPARPLDCTYWALILAMSGVSYETSSRFEESYE